MVEIKDRINCKSLISVLKNINLPVFNKLSRPNDIPSKVPDCGWNHGETDKK